MIKRYALFSFLVLVFFQANASHLRGGYITVTRVPGSLSCLITLKIFTNITGSAVKVGGDPDISYIHFGDGQRYFVEERQHVVSPDGLFGVVTVEIAHVYPAEGNYIVSYTEPNRNFGILNADNPGASVFYTDTFFNLNADFASTPVPLADPIFYGTSGNEFSMSLACRDERDLSLYYELTSPRSAANTRLLNYRKPESLTLNGVNGQITWDTKFEGALSAGEFVYAVRIYQADHGVVMGYMTVDLQVIITDGAQGRNLSGSKVVDENSRLYIPAGSQQTFRIFAEDAASEEIELNAFTELDNPILFPGAFSFSTYDSVEGDRIIKAGLVQLKNTAETVRDNPFPVVFRAKYSRSDNLLYKDLTYLTYTKDVELEFPGGAILGIEDDSDALRIYPNPVVDWLIIDMEKLKSVSLYGPDGKVIIEDQKVEEKKFDMRNLREGLYFLRVNTGNRSSAVRVLKVK